MNIYVDESGNLGTKDRYFVIAMCRFDHPKRIKNFVKRLSAGKNIQEIKAINLTYSEKELLIDRLKKDHVKKSPTLTTGFHI